MRPWSPEPPTPWTAGGQRSEQLLPVDQCGGRRWPIARWRVESVRRYDGRRRARNHRQPPHLRAAGRGAPRTSAAGPRSSGSGSQPYLAGAVGDRPARRGRRRADHRLSFGPVVLVGHSMGGFVAAALVRRSPDLVSGLVLVDGGLPFQPPRGIDVDQVIDLTLGPALQRLQRTFPSRDAYHRFWRAHPAFRESWSEAVADYVDYDLVGSPPELMILGVVAGGPPGRPGPIPRSGYGRPAGRLLRSGTATRGVTRAARPAARPLSRGGAGALAQPTALAEHRRSTTAEPLHDHVASVRRGPGRGSRLHTELTPELAYGLDGDGVSEAADEPGDGVLGGGNLTEYLTLAVVSAMYRPVWNQRTIAPMSLTIGLNGPTTAAAR